MQLSRIGRAKQKIALPKLQIIGAYQPKLFIRTANEANEANEANLHN